MKTHTRCSGSMSALYNSLHHSSSTYSTSLSEYMELPLQSKVYLHVSTGTLVSTGRPVEIEKKLEQEQLQRTVTVPLGDTIFQDLVRFVRRHS